VKLWNAATGGFVRVLTSYFDEASAVDFSSDSSVVASGSHDDTARITEAATGLTTCSLTTTGFVRDVSLAPQGGKLAVALGYFSNDLDLVSLASCELAAILTPSDGTVWTTAYSPDGAWLASGGADGDTVVYSMPAQLVFQFPEHEGDVTGVAFSPDGSRVASAGLFDHHVYVWGLPNGQLLLDLPAPGEFLHGLAIAPQGGWIAACGEVWPLHGTFHLWRLSDGAPLASYASGVGSNVLSVAFSPDGGSFVYGDSDGRLTRAVTPGAFVPYGSGKAGSNGVPSLTGAGDTTPGSAVGFTLAVTQAAPSASGLLFASTTLGSQPLLGGTFYPLPVVAQLPVTASASGTLSLAAAIPAGVPGSTELVLQAWFSDVGATKGASASPALVLAVK
jgi:hypothetical protein